MATKKKTKKPKQGRPESNLKVPADVLKFWKKNYNAGDFTKISEEKEIGRPTIRKAWNEKKASQVNIDKINEFYNERVKARTLMNEKVNLAISLNL